MENPLVQRCKDPRDGTFKALNEDGGCTEPWILSIERPDEEEGSTASKAVDADKLLIAADGTVTGLVTDAMVRRPQANINAANLAITTHYGLAAILTSKDDIKAAFQIGVKPGDIVDYFAVYDIIGPMLDRSGASLREEFERLGKEAAGTSSGGAAGPSAADIEHDNLVNQKLRLDIQLMELGFTVDEIKRLRDIFEDDRDYIEFVRQFGLDLDERQRSTDLTEGRLRRRDAADLQVSLEDLSLRRQDQEAEILRNPADFLARAFRQRGGTGPFDETTQADLINAIRDDFTAAADFRTETGSLDVEVAGAPSAGGGAGETPGAAPTEGGFRPLSGNEFLTNPDGASGEINPFGEGQDATDFIAAQETAGGDPMLASAQAFQKQINASVTGGTPTDKDGGPIGPVTKALLKNANDKFGEQFTFSTDGGEVAQNFAHGSKGFTRARRLIVGDRNVEATEIIDNPKGAPLRIIPAPGAADGVPLHVAADAGKDLPGVPGESRLPKFADGTGTHATEEVAAPIFEQRGTSQTPEGFVAAPTATIVGASPAPTAFQSASTPAPTAATAAPTAAPTAASGAAPLLSATPGVVESAKAPVFAPVTQSAFQAASTEIDLTGFTANQKARVASGELQAYVTPGGKVFIGTPNKPQNVLDSIYRELDNRPDNFADIVAAANSGASQEEITRLSGGDATAGGDLDDAIRITQEAIQRLADENAPRSVSAVFNDTDIPDLDVVGGFPDLKLFTPQMLAELTPDEVEALRTLLASRNLSLADFVHSQKRRFESRRTRARGRLNPLR